VAAGDEQAVGDVWEAAYVGEGHLPGTAAAAVRDVVGQLVDGVVLVAERDGAIVGAVVLTPPESPRAVVARPGELEVRRLGVARAARGAGVGEALVRACVQRARGRRAEAVVLWTRPVMTVAQRLYARLGFERVPDRDSVVEGQRRLVYRLALA
jgi:ribosomal protein S18 acetylase RimI-like enzyme